MIEESYVSFETAKLLKEKGFNEETRGYYPIKGDATGRLMFGSEYPHNNSQVQISAPTQQMTMQWLREVHDLHIMINCVGKVNYDPIIQCFDGKDFEVEGYEVGTTRIINGKRVNVRRGFRTYEEAVEAAIKYSLENLIQKTMKVNMTQEDKELLLKDLYARLPYGVKGIITYDESNTVFTIEGIDNNVLHLSDAEECHIEDFKPYLRPMSSMTEEEKKIMRSCGFELIHYDTGSYGFANIENCIDEISFKFMEEFLNAHHFDHRGLIPKGLALPLMCITNKQ